MRSQAELMENNTPGDLWESMISNAYWAAHDDDKFIINEKSNILKSKTKQKRTKCFVCYSYEGVEYIYTLSYLYYTAVGVVVLVGVGLIVSCLTGTLMIILINMHITDYNLLKPCDYLHDHIH